MKKMKINHLQREEDEKWGGVTIVNNRCDCELDESEPQ
jgi:hypothetical protein